MRLLPIIFLLLLTTGCAATYDVGPDMVDLAIRQSQTEAECMKAYAAASRVDCNGLTSQDCMMVKMQQQTAILVANATGKSGSPCGTGTNLFDVMNTEVAEKNATARTAIGSAAGVAKFGLGVWGATEVVDSIGSNAGGNINQTGDGTASVSRTSTQNDVSNSGEEGVASAGGADAAIPTEIPAGTEVVGDMEVTAE